VGGDHVPGNRRVVAVEEPAIELAAEEASVLGTLQVVKVTDLFASVSKAARS
jgi:hypothetical protein